MDIVICKAEAVAGQKVDGSTIHIWAGLQTFGDLNLAREVYQAEARILFDALTTSLPDGTLCELTVLLLQHRASLLRVPTITDEKAAPEAAKEG